MVVAPKAAAIEPVSTSGVRIPCMLLALILHGQSKATGVAQTSKSAVSQVSKPASAPAFGRDADLEIGDTAGLETCATPGSCVHVKASVKDAGLDLLNFNMKSSPTGWCWQSSRRGW